MEEIDVDFVNANRRHWMFNNADIRIEPCPARLPFPFFHGRLPPLRG